MLESSVKKNEVVNGKSPFFVLGPFSTWVVQFALAFAFDRAFAFDSLVWKCCPFIRSTLN